MLQGKEAMMGLYKIPLCSLRGQVGRHKMLPLSFRASYFCMELLLRSVLQQY